MSTYTFVPESLAALASSMFKSCSSLYWLSKPPAAARVVARAEKMMDGGGERELRWEAHVVVSLLTNCLTFGSDRSGGLRRARISMEETEAEARRVERMKAPTMPVQPRTEAVAIVKVECAVRCPRYRRFLPLLAKWYYLGSPRS